jgi:hypothetical protein
MRPALIGPALGGCEIWRSGWKNARGAGRTRRLLWTAVCGSHPTDFFREHARLDAIRSKLRVPVLLGAAPHNLCRFGYVSPLPDAHQAGSSWHEMEAFYPLHVYICDQSLLAQLQEFVTPDAIFSEYAYFSSYSTKWVEHASISEIGNCTVRRTRLRPTATRDRGELPHARPLS